MIEVLQRAGVKIEHGKIVLPSWCKRVKIDVGLSENAPQSESWLKEDSELVVFGFEPVSTSCESIVEGKSKFPIKLDVNRIGYSFYLLPIALTDQSGPTNLAFNVTKNDPGCSSALEPVDFEIQRSETVTAYSLSDFFDFFDFEGQVKLISYVKTDCQGYDINVLRGAEKYLKNIACYTCEMETKQYKGCQDNNIFEFTSIFDRNAFFQYKKSRVSRFFPFFDRFPFIQCDDPTFINRRYISDLKRITNKVSQRG